MSNAVASSNNPKNAIAVLQGPSVSQSQSGPILGTEINPQRRSGSGGPGVASASRVPASNARNNQSLRKQHKSQRRYRLADDDAAAESVSFLNMALLSFVASCRRTSSYPSAGSHAVHKQPQGTNLDNPFNELYITSSSSVVLSITS